MTRPDRLANMHRHGPSATRRMSAPDFLDTAAKLVAIAFGVATAPLPIVELDGRGRCGLCDRALPERIDQWDELAWHAPTCAHRLAKELING